MRMRRAMNAWMEKIGDLGLIPEPELVERMRPGGRPLETSAPVIEPGGGRFKGPVPIRIGCATEGASVAYTWEEGKEAAWKLYSREVSPPGSGTLRVKACRPGYVDSPEVQARFVIE